MAIDTLPNVEPTDEAAVNIDINEIEQAIVTPGQAIPISPETDDLTGTPSHATATSAEEKRIDVEEMIDIQEAMLEWENSLSSTKLGNVDESATLDDSTNTGGSMEVNIDLNDAMLEWDSSLSSGNADESVTLDDSSNSGGSMEVTTDLDDLMYDWSHPDASVDGYREFLLRTRPEVKELLDDPDYVRWNFPMLVPMEEYLDDLRVNSDDMPWNRPRDQDGEEKDLHQTTCPTVEGEDAIFQSSFNTDYSESTSLDRRASRRNQDRPNKVPSAIDEEDETYSDYSEYSLSRWFDSGSFDSLMLPQNNHKRMGPNEAEAQEPVTSPNGQPHAEADGESDGEADLSTNQPLPNGPVSSNPDTAQQCVETDSIVSRHAEPESFLMQIVMCFLTLCCCFRKPDGDSK
ncbi:hypothetical protein J6590_055712 [Homalodisca vitripennis]|nr:hypothetical protein J6590_055712 [Homalodisca vitripennis]